MSVLSARAFSVVGLIEENFDICNGITEVLYHKVPRAGSREALCHVLGNQENNNNNNNNNNNFFIVSHSSLQLLFINSELLSI